MEWIKWIPEGVDGVTNEKEWKVGQWRKRKAGGGTIFENGFGYGVMRLVAAAMENCTRDNALIFQIVFTGSSILLPFAQHLYLWEYLFQFK